MVPAQGGPRAVPPSSGRRPSAPASGPNGSGASSQGGAVAPSGEGRGAGESQEATADTDPSADPPAFAPSAAIGHPATAGPPAAVGDERFRALFGELPAGVAVSGPDGRFLEVNATLRRVLAGTGIDPDTDGLTDLVRHLPTGADEAIAWPRALADVVAGRAPVAQVEVPAGPVGESPRWIRVTAALIGLGSRRVLLSHVEDTTARRLAEYRTLELTLPDGLTGFAGRLLLTERLEAALARSGESGLRVAVLAIDLDEFRRINDVLGQEAGDTVLSRTGGRLSGVVRTGDTAGRVGADEFVVIARGVPDDAALAELTARVARCLSEPMDVGRARLSVSASVGGCLARPGDTLTTALQRAGRAMEQVKRARRSSATVGVADLEDTGADLRDTPLDLADDRLDLAAGRLGLADGRTGRTGGPPGRDPAH